MENAALVVIFYVFGQVTMDNLGFYLRVQADSDSVVG
jgi:hypothetical protein